MPSAIECPHCRRMLRLHEEDAGKTVQCPACLGAFTARGEEEGAFFAMPALDFESASLDLPDRQTLQRTPVPPEYKPPERRPPDDEEEKVYAVQLGAEATVSEEEEKRQRRRRISELEKREEESEIEPHRGVIVLVLGILSLLFACVPPLSWVLGGISMAMGASDIHRMDDRLMDRSGRAMTRAGQVCGILGAFLGSIMFILEAVISVNSARH